MRSSAAPLLLPLLLLLTAPATEGYLPSCGYGGVFDTSEGCCSTIGCQNICPAGQECKLQLPTPCAAPPDPEPPCYCPARKACEPVNQCGGIGGVFDSTQGCCTVIGCESGCPKGYECRLQPPTPCARPPIPTPPCYCPRISSCEPISEPNQCGIGGVFDPNQGCCSTIGCSEPCPFGQSCKESLPTPCAAPPFPQPPCYCPTRMHCQP